MVSLLEYRSASKVLVKIFPYVKNSETVNNNGIQDK